MMHSERLAPNCITERWRSIKNAYNAWITPNTLKWKERFLSYEYPALHPIQTETAKQVWDALACGGFCALYDDGCAWSLRFSRECSPKHNGYETLVNWLGMEDENDNWNEGVDREWSKDIHLIQPFNNLYDRCYFSLYDLIYIREFNLEVHVEFDGKVKYLPHIGH